MIFICAWPENAGGPNVNDTLKSTRLCVCVCVCVFLSFLNCVCVVVVVVFVFLSLTHRQGQHERT